MPHTAGPWFADPPGSGTIGSIVNSMGDTVAQAMQMLPRDEDILQEHRKANAQLIAAAPDLLKALKAARQEFDECCADTQGTPTQQHFASLLRLCDAAIAKAEGEINA